MRKSIHVTVNVNVEPVIMEEYFTDIQQESYDKILNVIEEYLLSNNDVLRIIIQRVRIDNDEERPEISKAMREMAEKTRRNAIEESK